ncbi:MAG: ribose 5-phosphate isomerase A [Phycisphaeraceae bacterium]|nr:ribose 5-phosphate isomerase A [Phycisphaeraceae bacterium]
MAEQRVIDALADAVVADITSGMIVGLGTGRTAKRGIKALADRVREEGLDVQCASSSLGSEQVARELGLSIVDFPTLERVDYFFDGADEVDRELRVLKGSGGAMTRERLLAWASDRVVYMVDEHKLVARLGTKNTLAIAVVGFGLASIRAKLRAIGLSGVCRRTIQGEHFVTDNGNLVLDVGLPEDANLELIAAELNDIPGVVDHGLFLNEADELLIDHDGAIERIIRPD